MKKVAVLLSGGVDSAVAALLLKDAGAELRCFYLKIWLEDELSFLGNCPWEEDLSFARAVAEQLHAPLEVLPLQTQYHERVVAHALAELRAGRTPSPDILCNSRVKFGAFLEAVGKHFPLVASGHYARIERRAGRSVLLRAADPVKDQTYFLCGLSQEQLGRALFPIGAMTKAEVRELALSAGLAPAQRPDSQGICFLGRIRYRDFVRHHLGEREGEIRELESGRVLGHHEGVWFHTLGQRKGLGLSGGPWFVVAKDLESNLLYVSHAEALPQYLRRDFELSGLHWLSEPPRQPANLRVKLRHGPEDRACALKLLPGERGLVRLEQGDAGVAAGQQAVFYDGELCLGGGVIELDQRLAPEPG